MHCVLDRCCDSLCTSPNSFRLEAEGSGSNGLYLLLLNLKKKEEKKDADDEPPYPHRSEEAMS